MAQFSWCAMMHIALNFILGTKEEKAFGFNAEVGAGHLKIGGFLRACEVERVSILSLMSLFFPGAQEGIWTLAYYFGCKM